MRRVICDCFLTGWIKAWRRGMFQVFVTVWWIFMGFVIRQVDRRIGWGIRWEYLLLFVVCIIFFCFKIIKLRFVSKIIVNSFLYNERVKVSVVFRRIFLFVNQFKGLLLFVIGFFVRLIVFLLICQVIVVFNEGSGEFFEFYYKDKEKVEKENMEEGG